MLAAPFKVVLDANVLYPFTLRDTLPKAAGLSPRARSTTSLPRSPKWFRGSPPR